MCGQLLSHNQQTPTSERCNELFNQYIDRQHSTCKHATNTPNTLKPVNKQTTHNQPVHVVQIGVVITFENPRKRSKRIQKKHNLR